MVKNSSAALPDPSSENRTHTETSKDPESPSSLTSKTPVSLVSHPLKDLFQDPSSLVSSTPLRQTSDRSFWPSLQTSALGNLWIFNGPVQFQLSLSDEKMKNLVTSKPFDLKPTPLPDTNITVARSHDLVEDHGLVLASAAVDDGEQNADLQVRAHADGQQGDTDLQPEVAPLQVTDGQQGDTDLQHEVAPLQLTNVTEALADYFRGDHQRY